MDPKRGSAFGPGKKVQSAKLLAQSLNITFHNNNLLKQALVHSSYVNENPAMAASDQNERLEFLGDAVLGFVICDYLFQNFADKQEGVLTKIKSLVVSKPILAEQARKLSLGDYLLLGRGEEGSGGRSRDSLLANCFEALLGAIYLDQGIEKVTQFIISHLEEAIHKPLSFEKHHDYKTALQEYTQKKLRLIPSYQKIKEVGPDHAKKYHFEVRLPNGIVGIGQGSSKKEAEQEAARDAYKKITAAEEL